MTQRRPTPFSGAGLLPAVLRTLAAPSKLAANGKDGLNVSGISSIESNRTAPKCFSLARAKHMRAQDRLRIWVCSSPLSTSGEGGLPASITAE